MPLHDIRGIYCPMGCGETLHLMGSGMIGCVSYSCPDTGAAQKILSDQETEHVVVYRGGTYVVRHPLRERIGDVLVECELAAAVFRLSDHPREDGRYRMWLDENDRLVRKRLDGLVDLLGFARAQLDEDDRRNRASWWGRYKRRFSKRKAQINREIQAKRWIMDEHVPSYPAVAPLGEPEQAVAVMDPGGVTGTFAYCSTCDTVAPCPTVRYVVWTWCDRPGYRAEWRP